MSSLPCGVRSCAAYAHTACASRTCSDGHPFVHAPSVPQLQAHQALPPCRPHLRDDEALWEPSCVSHLSGPLIGDRIIARAHTDMSVHVSLARTATARTVANGKSPAPARGLGSPWLMRPTRDASSHRSGDPHRAGSGETERRTSDRSAARWGFPPTARRPPAAPRRS